MLFLEVIVLSASSNITVKYAVEVNPQWLHYTKFDYIFFQISSFCGFCILCFRPYTLVSFSKLEGIIIIPSLVMFQLIIVSIFSCRLELCWYSAIYSLYFHLSVVRLFSTNSVFSETWCRICVSLYGSQPTRIKLRYYFSYLRFGQRNRLWFVCL